MLPGFSRGYDHFGQIWKLLSAKKVARTNKKPACRSKRAFVINQRNFIVRSKP